MPTTGEIHTCPLRATDADPAIANAVDQDSWNLVNGMRSCTFCGSMEPDEVSDYIRVNGNDKLTFTEDANTMSVATGTSPSVYHRWHDTWKFGQDLQALGWM